MKNTCVSYHSKSKEMSKLNYNDYLHNSNTYNPKLMVKIIKFGMRHMV